MLNQINPKSGPSQETQPLLPQFPEPVSTKTSASQPYQPPRYSSNIEKVLQHATHQIDQLRQSIQQRYW